MRDEALHVSKVFDSTLYVERAKSGASEFQKNLPFKHIVIDDFLPTAVAQQLSDEYPSDVDNDGWKFHNNRNVSRYFLENIVLFPNSLRCFATALQGPSFLLFLEVLTGIKNILPDPYYLGGGAMATGSGGFLNVHVDFNWSQKLQCWRRLNCLFYLTPEWNDAWGGDLELWSPDGLSCELRVVPKFNRMVVFETTDTSYHGQPDPLKCPINKFRNVFSAFYYTTSRPISADTSPRYTTYLDGPNNESEKVLMETSPYTEQITQKYLSGKFFQNDSN